jgi:hypothetical protein
MSSDRERLYDLQYEAWRSGRNPDDVSEDNYDSCRSSGYHPDEIGLEDVLPSRHGGDDD